MEKSDPHSTHPNEFLGHSATIDGPGHFWDRFNRWEIGLVQIAVHNAQSYYLRKTAVVINRLSDGWLYVIIGLLLLAVQGQGAWRVILSAGMAAGVSHIIYPIIKKRVARLRPCDYDRSLDLGHKVLDKYSCPSGHVMTAVAVAIPLLIQHPSLMPLIVVSCLTIGWARVSVGHHYPSDLFFGLFLGTLISLPVSSFLI